MSRRSGVPCCLFHTLPLIMSVGRSSARHFLQKNHPQPSTFTCVTSRKISIKHRKERCALAQITRKLASTAAAPKTELGNQLTKHRLATRCTHHASKRLASSVAYHFRSSWSSEQCCHNALLHECEVRSLNASLPHCTCYTCHSRCHLRAQFLKYSSEISSG